MPEEKSFRSGEMRGGSPDHNLTVVNREQVVVSGVAAVASFDDQEIVLETELGSLTIRGEELNIKQLDLDSGRFAVDGLVNALIYSGRTGRQASRGRSRGGFLDRLLR
ncbi:MAG: sporulation protein YabP [Bacillota bacterium]